MRVRTHELCKYIIIYTRYMHIIIMLLRLSYLSLNVSTGSCLEIIYYIYNPRLMIFCKNLLCEVKPPFIAKSSQDNSFHMIYT
jgi:hypothetical protein